MVDRGGRATRAPHGARAAPPGGTARAGRSMGVDHQDGKRSGPSGDDCGSHHDGRRPRQATAASGRHCPYRYGRSSRADAYGLAGATSARKMAGAPRRAELPLPARDLVHARHPGAPQRGSTRRQASRECWPQGLSPWSATAGSASVCTGRATRPQACCSRSPSAPWSPPTQGAQLPATNRGEHSERE